MDNNSIKEINPTPETAPSDISALKCDKGFAKQQKYHSEICSYTDEKSAETDLVKVDGKSAIDQCMNGDWYHDSDKKYLFVCLSGDAPAARQDEPTTTFPL
jgi:hypothetical protein